MAARRDIATALQKLRSFLLGREYTNALRFEDGLAARTQPPPDVPGGPAHVLSANYYYSRDSRRMVQPPIDVSKAALTSGKTGESAALSTPYQTPGKVYQY